MADEKRTVRVPLLLTSEEVKELDDWQFSNRLRTRSDALREMMRREIERSRAGAAAAQAPASRAKAKAASARLYQVRRSA
jgi:hypothetical protein